MLTTPFGSATLNGKICIVKPFVVVVFVVGADIKVGEPTSDSAVEVDVLVGETVNVENVVVVAVFGLVAVNRGER